MPALKKIIISCLVLFLLLIGFITLILPGMVKDRTEHWVATETGRTLTIGQININPFGLNVTVKDLALSEVDPTQSFLAWDELRVSLSVASLYHMAPVIDELLLEGPRLNLERLDETRFNFSDLLPPEEPDKKPEPDAKPAAFSINNLVISNGTITLSDLSLEEPVQHHINDLHLALPSIGNLPYMVEEPVQPLLKAVINDAPLEITGEAKPFAEALEMRFVIELDSIDLPYYLAYVPIELPVKLNNGLVNLELNLLYRAKAKAAPQLVVSGHVDLITLDIDDRLGEPLFFLPLLQAEFAPSRPLEKQIHLSSLSIYNLEVKLNRDLQGVWNHSRLRPEAAASPTEDEENDEATVPLQLQVDTVEVRDGVLVFRDEQPEQPFETTAKEINIDISNFALDATEMSPFTLDLETARRERVAVNGGFLLSPLTVDLHADFKDLQAAAYEPYYHEVYAGPLGGTIALAANLQVSPEQSLLVSDATLAWDGASMAFNDDEGMSFDHIQVDNLSFALDRNRLEVESVRYRGGGMSLSRSREGHWSFMSRNFPILAKLTEAPSTAPESVSQEEGPALSYRIGELNIQNWRVDMTDRQPQKPVSLSASQINFKASNLAAPEVVESPLAFSMVFQERGQISVKGTGSLTNQSADLNSELKNIPLESLAPYVAEQTNLLLKRGRFDMTLGTRIEDGDAPVVTFDGDVAISRLRILDAIHGEDLLKWDSLQLAKVSGRSSPPTLDIESITLSDYFVKVLLDENLNLNLATAFSKEAPQEPEAASGDLEPEATTEATESYAAETEGPQPRISIGTVVLQGGSVDFTDRSLPKTFHADMTELGGRITGLDSDAAARAEVDLRGSLQNQSPLEISGTANPLAAEPSLDLKISFREIDLSPMSPYSGTYVGYLIDKGKLNLALEYTLAEGRLQAQNQVFLDQFTFGEPVESDKSIGLPVKLAVALLKDRNGEIHLDIPVTGSLDDPEFSIGGVIWQVIRNLLVKAATSPIALLGAMFGGGEGDFSSIHFAYGSARLAPPEQEKLAKLAEALQDRPSLDIEVKAFIDPDNDPEGYRREQLRLAMLRLKYDQLAESGQLNEGVAEELVEISADEYEDYLWQVYKDAAFPKPRNLIGMTKKIPPSEQEKLYYANTRVGDEELTKLARERALNVQSYLVKETGLDPSRVFLTRPDISAPPATDGAVRSRVEFGVNVQ